MEDGRGDVAERAAFAHEQAFETLAVDYNFHGVHRVAGMRFVDGGFEELVAVAVVGCDDESRSEFVGRARDFFHAFVDGFDRFDGGFEVAGARPCRRLRSLRR